MPRYVRKWVFKMKKAFTLLELIVVIVIIGIIASFAIPNYQNSIERAHERDAILNLTALHSSNQVYRSQTGSYWPSSNNQDVVAINSNLGLNILENGMTYECDGNGTTFTCTAVRNAPANSFTVTVTQQVISATNPSCTAGSCP